VSAKLQYLLDTHILSETPKRQTDERVVSFLSADEPSAVYISVLTVKEQRKGVALKRREEDRGLGRWIGVQLWGPHRRHQCGYGEVMGRTVRTTPETSDRYTAGRNRDRA